MRRSLHDRRRRHRGLDAASAGVAAPFQPVHRRHSRVRPAALLRPRAARAADTRSARLAQRPADGRATHRQDELPPPPAACGWPSQDGSRAPLLTRLRGSRRRDRSRISSTPLMEEAVEALGRAAAATLAELRFRRLGRAGTRRLTSTTTCGCAGRRVCVSRTLQPVRLVLLIDEIDAVSAGLGSIRRPLASARLLAAAGRSSGSCLARRSERARAREALELEPSRRRDAQALVKSRWRASSATSLSAVGAHPGGEPHATLRDPEALPARRAIACSTTVARRFDWRTWSALSRVQFGLNGAT